VLVKSAAAAVNAAEKKNALDRQAIVDVFMAQVPFTVFDEGALFTRPDRFARSEGRMVRHCGATPPAPRMFCVRTMVS
jgi:hypothetical protein